MHAVDIAHCLLRMFLPAYSIHTNDGSSPKLIRVLSPSIATPQECTHQFIQQPPVKLNCRPLEIVIRLQCAASSTEDVVAWLWSRSKNHAGSNGTLIVSNSHQNVYKILQHVHHLTINVTESTLGYYWCEIRNAGGMSLRPTTITPVCPPQDDDCLPQCTTQAVSRLHSNVLTCAEATGNYSRPSLPDCSILTPSRSCTTTTSHNMLATTTILITPAAASPSMTPALEDPSSPPPLPFSIWIMVGLIVAMGAVFSCVAVIVTLCCYHSNNAHSSKRYTVIVLY